MKLIRKDFLHCLAALLIVITCPAIAKEQITIYTAVQPEQISRYKNAFEKEYPDIELVFVRDSAGPIAARIKAERGHSKADAVLGLSVIALDALAQEGLLESYLPKGWEALNPKFIAPSHTWIGMNAWGGAICVNTDLLSKRGLPVPRTWDDLLDPRYRGLIAMPHPASSSTGYMFLLGWLQSFGDTKAWDYMQALHRNILMYTFSGSRPIAMVAQGEVAIGLSSAAFTAPYRTYKIPMAIIEPDSGIPWDAEGSAIPKGSPHPALAKKFLDFCASGAVAKIAASFSGIAAIDRYSTPAGQQTASRFLPLNFERAAKDKRKIITDWQQLFD